MTKDIILSLIYFLENNLSNVTVGRQTPEEKQLPAVIIREGDSSYKYIEIGGKSFTRAMSIHLEIFARNDLERFNLKDQLITLLKKSDIPLYKCELDSQSNVIIGDLICYFNVEYITDYRVMLGEDLSNLDLIDRYRHLITVKFNFGKIE